jgi:hypothetical protein
MFLSIVIPTEKVSRYSKESCREKMSWEDLTHSAEPRRGELVVVVAVNLNGFFVYGLRASP